MNSDLTSRSQDAPRWVTLAIAATGLLLICVDMTVLYIALPALLWCGTAVAIRVLVDKEYSV